MAQHIGDLVVTGKTVISNHVTGVTHVKRGGKLVSSGELLGGLVVEAGGSAAVSGRIGRNILNEGNLVLSGEVAGRILGTGPVVIGKQTRVGNADLPIEPVSETA
jgi:hypothetical protein